MFQYHVGNTVDKSRHEGIEREDSEMGVGMKGGNGKGRHYMLSKSKR